VAEWAAGLQEEGYVRVQVDGKVFRLDELAATSVKFATPCWVLIDRLEAGKVTPERLIDSVETAFNRGEGRLGLLTDQEERTFDQHLVCPTCQIPYPALEPRLFSFNDPLGACPTCEGIGFVRPGKRGAEQECPTCHGSRLGELAGIARVGGLTIGQLCALSARKLADFLDNLTLEEREGPVALVLVEQMRTRLDYLLGVDLGYLSLDRAAASLSTGESQRLRLTTALGSSLVNALYVLDEPTSGLHASERKKLLAVLRRLRDEGNTVVLVEHDVDVIRAAGYVVDLGPGAGEEGGRVLFQGSPSGIAGTEESVTGAYLTGRLRTAVPSRRRPQERGQLRLVGARAHNLKDLTIDFPLGVLCVVTGVSGAGKSSLVQETLYPALCQRKRLKGPPTPLPPETDLIGAGQLEGIVLMDQAPLARTARSNAATYIKAFNDIRALFADTTEARVRNFGPGDFSFNQPGGRCETCEGQGTLTVDMQFLADVTVTCPDCQGARYRRDILSVKVRNLSIAEVLELTVREAFPFFRGQPPIARRLKLLIDVGLEYLRLGQPADTLSGGECQRLKLAGHLAASRKPRCLFLLDEPSAGLHPADVVWLLSCFDRLLETGHSLIVVEHDLDIIKCADHIIDLGPGAGADGGQVVAAGTPEVVAATPGSVTGEWLRRALEG
jgi:excinuclease ABC subunit A